MRGSLGEAVGWLTEEINFPKQAKRLDKSRTPLVKCHYNFGRLTILSCGSGLYANRWSNDLFGRIWFYGAVRYDFGGQVRPAQSRLRFVLFRFVYVYAKYEPIKRERDKKGR